MDVIKFTQERNRMCKHYTGGCSGCPLSDIACGNFATVNIEVVVPIVEQWSKEHPIKTRQSVFLEAFPNVRLVDGVVDIAPCQMEPKSYSSGAGGCKYAPCVICRSEFWMQEVE